MGWPDLNSGAFKRRADRAEMLQMCAENLKVTAGDRSGNGISSGLDAVGNQVVARVLESIDALHENAMRSRALDARAHRGQTERKVADFRIARCVQDFGFTACEDCGR